MIGMARSRKKKVEADEQLAKDDRSVATDAFAAGECEASSPGASQSSSDESVCFTAREKKEMLAVAKYEALAEHAQNLRLAAENERKIKQNAQRLHDDKMKRLEAGVISAIGASRASGQLAERMKQ